YKHFCRTKLYPAQFLLIRPTLQFRDNRPFQQVSMPADSVPHCFVHKRSSLDIDTLPRTCTEDKDLPTREALVQRMKFISAMEGLDSALPDETVELMYQAVEVCVNCVLLK